MFKKIYIALFTIILFTPMANAAPVLWLGDSSGRLGTVDVGTGAVNVIGRMGRTMTDIAFDASGNLWGITFIGLYSINKTTAASTLVGNFGRGSLNALVFASDGTLYGAGGGALFSLNTGTGLASTIGSGPRNSSGDLAFVGGELFLSTIDFPSDALVKVNTFDGSRTYVGRTGFTNVYGLASPDGANLYGLSGTSILSISTATGLGSFIRDYSGHGLGQAYGSAFISEATPAVPVPAALFMFAPALLGFLGLRRKAKNVIA